VLWDGLALFPFAGPFRFYGNSHPKNGPPAPQVRTGGEEMEGPAAGSRSAASSRALLAAPFIWALQPSRALVPTRINHASRKAAFHQVIRRMSVHFELLAGSD
jgi:hypothetical protein